MKYCSCYYCMYPTTKFSSLNRRIFSALKHEYIGRFNENMRYTQKNNHTWKILNSKNEGLHMIAEKVEIQSLYFSDLKMNSNVESIKCNQHSFSKVFWTEKFDETEYGVTQFILLNDVTQNGVSVSDFGKGSSEKDYDHVMLIVENVDPTDNKCILIVSCIMYIVDVNGEK